MTLMGRGSHSAGGANAPPTFGLYSAEMGPCSTNFFGSKMIIWMVTKNGEVASVDWCFDAAWAQSSPPPR